MVSVSNSTDPYPPIEEDLKLTRECFKLFAEYGIRYLIVTKSDMFLRDLDILRNSRTAVTVTITTLDKGLAKRVEPNAPSPERRIKALKKLKEYGIPAGVRVDPIIPGLNDKEIEEIIKNVSPYISHITFSTFKPRYDSFRRFERLFPAVYEKTKTLYSERIGNSFYLEKEMRRIFIERAHKMAKKENLSFGLCREGFREYINAPSCDGSHLVP